MICFKAVQGRYDKVSKKMLPIGREVIYIKSAKPEMENDSPIKEGATNTQPIYNTKSRIFSHFLSRLRNALHMLQIHSEMKNNNTLEEK
jgi:hypothetical protein